MDQARFSQGIRIERLAPEEEARRDDWLHALRGFDAAAATVLKSEGANTVFRATMLGRPVVIKTWVHTTLSSRLKLALRASRACRHWEGAAWLSEHGFTTAPVLLLAAEYVRGGAVEWLIMDHLAGKSLLEEMDGASLPPKKQHSLAVAVGEQAARMVLAGRFNRDHKPSNLIVTDAGPAVIDCVAIRICPSGSRRALTRMLASLVIEPTGVGCRPRRAVLMRAVAAAARALLGGSASRIERRNLARDLWWRVELAVARHGDPTPRVDPRTRN